MSLAGCTEMAVATSERHADLGTGSVALSASASALVTIDERRSLVVTEQPILARFSFQRVMSQLASQAAVPGLTPTKLFQQWWDTQNPGSGVMAGEHCDAQVDPTLGPVLNGFPYTCRPAPAEGAQASCNPFTDAACSYMPVGLFSRFDLAPEDGAHCGEYRVVFAKTTGQTDSRDRNLLIFEAALPNPEPRRGIEGCRSIARFWADLSRVDNIEQRAARLERFYFKGLDRSTRPVIDIRNYGDNAGSFGQVRTNQFVQSGEVRQWSLREFKLRRKCEVRGEGCRRRETCTLTFDRTTNKRNPFGPLFSEASTHPLAAAFKSSFAEQVESLAAADLNSIGMQVPDSFNSAQSQASGSTETNYLANFEDGGEFADSIEERLDVMDSLLEPVDIVARAQTQSCAGCHRLSNNADLGNGLIWPASLGFTHVTETQPEVVNGVTRFRISDALVNTFLPHRKQILADFLAGYRSTPRGYDSLGGHSVH